MTIEYKDSKRIVALSNDILDTVDYENTSAVSLGTGDSGTSIDLTGSTLDNSWTLRFKVTMTSLGTGSSLLFMVQNSTTTTVSTARDGIGLRQTDSANFYDFEGCDNVAGNAGQYDHRFTTTPATDTKYVQIKRISATSAKIEFYDSTYTTVSESSGNIEIANITGLRYFVISNNGSALTVDDIDFWNGIVTNKPTNVQDNSLLVEKDTARRYWFTPQTVDTEEAFSFTTTDTVNALWGNRILGMKLLSGHSGLNKYIKKIKTYHPTNPTGSRLTTGTLYHVILDSSGTEIARSAGVSALSVSNNSWAETTLSTPVKLEENYTVGMTISTGDANTYLGTGVNNNSSSPTNTTRYYKDESGTESTSTSETMLMVFDSDPATGLSIPATWTMQPTFEDDFSSDNFTQTGTEIDVSGGELVWDAQPDGTTTGGYIDFGENLSDTAWVCRFKVQVNNYSGAVTTATNFFIQLQSITTVDSTTSRDSMGIHLRLKSGNTDWRVEAVDGSVAGGGAGNLIDGSATIETIYVQMYRDGNTIYAEWYDNADYTGIPTNTANHSSGTPANLRYFAVYRRSDTTTTGVSNGIIDDLKIYNGVTSIN